VLIQPVQQIMSHWRKPFQAKQPALALLLACSALLLGCQPKVASNPVEFRVPVTVSQTTTQTVEELVITTGTVKAKNVATLDVASEGVLEIAKITDPQSGRSRQLAEGDLVQAGQVIANITGEDVRLTANKELAQKKLDIAQKNFEIANTLLEKNLISVVDYGKEKLALEDAKNTLEKANHSEQSSSIVSPVTGVVIRLARDDGQLMANGQLVNTGQVIAQIAPLDDVIIATDLVGSDMSRVAPGTKARATSHAWAGKQFKGQIQRLAPTVDDITRTLSAEVQVANQDGLLKPGMFVEVALVVKQKPNALVIPKHAITERGGQSVVFVLKGQRVEQRLVKLGIDGGDHVEVLSGVNADESIVVHGLQTLTDQMPVRVSRI